MRPPAAVPTSSGAGREIPPSCASACHVPAWSWAKSAIPLHRASFNSCRTYQHNDGHADTLRALKAGQTCSAERRRQEFHSQLSKSLQLAVIRHPAIKEYGIKIEARDASYVTASFLVPKKYVIRAEPRDAPCLQANGDSLCWVRRIKPGEAGRAVAQRQLGAVPVGARAMDLPNAQAVLAGRGPAAVPGCQVAALGSHPDRHMFACSRDRSQADSGRTGSRASLLCSAICRKREKSSCVKTCSARARTSYNSPDLAVTCCHIL